MKNENMNRYGSRRRKSPKIEITELFMAKKGKNGWSHFFHGVICREKDEHGNETGVNGNIVIPGEGIIWSRDRNQDVYGANLDDIIELRFDRKIHDNPGASMEIAEQKYFLN